MTDYSSIVVLLARQRSGTNALRSVLDTHPDIFCIPEIFHPRPTPDWDLDVDANFFRFVQNHTEGSVASLLALDSYEDLFLDFLAYLRCLSDKTFVLVDVKYNSTHHLDGAWRFITEQPALFGFIRRYNLRLLHICRSNYLRYYLSEFKANLTRTWEEFDEAVVSDRPWYVRKYAGQIKRSDVVINIDPADLFRVLELCKAETDLVEEAFSGYAPYCAMEYEDLFTTIGAPIADEALTRVAEWLGVEPTFAERRPQYRKQSDLPLTKTIANYRDVAKALRGTEFEYCLSDEKIYRAPSGVGRGVRALKRSREVGSAA